MGLSIKAGGLVLLPSVLGILMWQYGLGKLTLAVTWILAWYYMTAAPFIFDPVARLLGFENGAQTSHFDYFARSTKILSPDGS